MIIKRFGAINSIGLVAALLLATMVLFQQTVTGCNSAHAADTSELDFCLSVEVDITNNTGGTLTNKPIRMEFTAGNLVLNQTLDPRAWDVVPTAGGSFASEVPLTAQDMTSNAAPWWTTIASINDGETQTLEMFMGNGEARRDQAMIFEGGTEVVLDGLDANTYVATPQIELWVYNTDDTARDQSIIDHGTGLAGYHIFLNDNAGTLELGAVGDSAASGTVTWNPTWSNRWTFIQVYFSNSAGADLDIYVDGSPVGIFNRGHGNLTNPSTDLRIGNGDDGYLTGMLIRDARSCINIRPGECSNIEGFTDWHISFDANNMTENISSTNPYQGTITEDQNGVATTYEIDEDQSNILVVVNNPTLTSLTVGAVVDPQLLDVTGQVLPDDIFDPVIKDTTSPFYTWVIQPLEGLFDQEWLGPTLFLYALGAVFALALAKWTEHQIMAMYLTVFGFPAGIGAFNGWVPWPFVLLWILVVFVTWTGLIRMIKEAF